MVVVGAGNPERTFLQAVNRALDAIGENNVGGLANPTDRMNKAMRAVQDARDDIFYKKKWEWRREHLQINIVALQMWYELPADYHDMASHVSMNRTDKVIGFVRYDDMMLKYPNLRSFPPGAGVGGLESLTQLTAQTESFGVPTEYTVWQRDYIGLMPIPDADFITAEGSNLYAHYWRQASTLTVDNDDIGLDRELWGCHDLLAAAYMKKKTGYADWVDDKADGLRILNERASNQGNDQDLHIYDDPLINYND